MWKRICGAIGWLFGRRPRLPTPVWRHGEPRPELPEGWTWAKPQKPPSGWVNLHVTRETFELIGRRSAKRGVAPVTFVNAMLWWGGRLSDDEARVLVWEYLQRAAPDVHCRAEPETVYLGQPKKEESRNASESKNGTAGGQVPPVSDPDKRVA